MNIKIRAWCLNSRQYSYCDGIYLQEGLTLQDLFDDPEQIFELYTGLKDANGVEIYEGDIVHYCYQPGEGFWNEDTRATILWNSTGFYMSSFKNGKKCGYQGWLVSLPGASAKEEPNTLFEVIGNIHANPELLEAS